MIQRLRSAFGTGILLLVPLLATLDILLWFFNVIDQFFRRFLPAPWFPDVKGLGLCLAILLILGVGILGQNLLGRWFFGALDNVLRRLTIVGGLYGAIKKFLESVLHPQGEQFHGVVLVQFPRDGLYSIGFRTGLPDYRLPLKGGKKWVNVFIPCTPNPTSGFYLLVAEEDLVPVAMSVQEAFKSILSLGIVHAEGDPKGG